MADKLGVLGSSTTASLGTVTAYTVPTAKAARCKLFFKAKGAAAGGTIIDIFVNGLKIGRVGAMTADYYVFSIKGAGLRVAEQAAEPTGIAAGLTVAPADQVYYLSAGDTVQYTISGVAAAAMDFQVVGFELDS